MRSLKPGNCLRLGGQKIEQVPLRHQRDELAVRRQRSEIGGLECEVAENSAGGGQLLVRNCKEIVEDAELVHHLERRRMHGVAAEVAEEILVLLQHRDVDASSRQQIAEHHARRSAAHHTTRCFHCFVCHD